MAINTPHSPANGKNASVAPLGGIALIAMACLCFSILDATAKYLSNDLPILQIVWVRFVSHVAITFVLFRIWSNPGLLKTKRPVLQVLRGLCLVGTTAFNFLAVQYLQLAETVSIMFAGPFVITALAGPLLGEWAGPRRWAAIVVGFIGVLIVTQPGLGGMHWAAIYCVIAMFFMVAYSLLTRHLTATENPSGMLVISGIAGAVAIAPAGITVWVPPADAWTWALMLATGAMGGGGHFLFIQAHRLAPAPVLAPFIYTQIVWMVALGYVIFADIPTSATLIGASIVVVSGLYILYRERIRGV